jgi:predicted permease
MSRLLFDLRYALRMLRRQKGFTAVAVATLALGIGANTAMFSVLYAVLLEPLSYDRADRVVAVYTTTSERGESGVSRLEFEDWRNQSRSFSTLAAYRGDSADVVGGNEPERVVAAAVSGGFFQTFAVAPIAGRVFDAERERGSGATPVLLSEGFWRSHFGARRDAVGSVVRIYDEPHMIVGVLPASFDYPWQPQVWLPLGSSERDTSRSARNYHVVGRLKQSVSAEQAATELRAIAARLAQTYPDSNGGVGVTLRTLRDDLTAAVRPTLWLLFGLVALVLLIACVNVANLLLARGRARTAEIALRGALGASGGRIVRQLVTESVVLAAIGGLCGIIVAIWVSRLLAQSALLDRFLIRTPALNAPVLLFALGLSLVTALVFGIIPAIRLARTELAGGSLQQMMRRDVKDPLRRHLVAAEVALSVLLLIAAGLMSRSMFRLQSEPLGFDPSAMRVVRVSPPAEPNRDWVAFYDAALEQVRALPGVTAVAASSDLPLGPDKTQGGVVIEGRPAPDEKSWLPAAWQLVSEDYFAGMRIPLRRGRAFSSDDRGGMKVAVVSETFARRYWPNGDVLGKQLAIPGLDAASYESYQKGTLDWITVAGIAADVRPGGPASEALPEIYLPYFQHPSDPTNLAIAVRSPLGGGALDRAIKSAMYALAPETPVRMRSYEELLEERLAAPGLRSLLVLLFAALAIVLAAGGVYGVTSHWVEQRTREIGIRMAVGAGVRDVVLLFFRRGVVPTLIGVALGLAGAVWLVRLLVPFLFRVSPRDPLTFLGAALIAVLMVALATFIPARRASRVNPVETLRYD